ncbi:bifunctional heptose 7-phosphate kinase/heptose 1-phosphate adenyltransferase [Selenomonas sp. oral taxon 478]|uniref:bifunctional heptose 7-phosphate kinase/heptose 1-phosphate adenyltransferase n=1 Tax=Selenomonas sp. oral taxon 478 TaxID=712538 RepID=UPI00067A1937|nr:PfkB family carbohydrate kinase [Selenomonas sp. oral taxon 478]AKT53877.1 carbohydrate kinase [Selenomonas sp. oral taxon 478]
MVSALERLKNAPVLIIGDMVADVYLDGTIARISREAPVLVLEQREERVVAGGAANVANNAATLGGRSYAVGVCGMDAGADALCAVLGENAVDTAGLVRDAVRPTITKTRIIAGGRATVSQQIVRVDREWHTPLAAAVEECLLTEIMRLLPQVRAVVLSDYGSGTVTERVRRTVIDAAHAAGIPSIVDARYDILSYAGVGYVKQNDAELAAALGRELRSAADIHAAGRELLARLSADGVLITRGADGMTLFLADGSATDIPVSDHSEIFDVSGAGDTCVAVMALALAAGVDPVTAARLSNTASGIAVRKRGTATVAWAELQAALTAEGDAHAHS